MKNFSIIKRSYIWISLGAVMMFGAVLLFFLNFRPSIEFTGGIDMKINYSQDSNKLKETLTQTLTNSGYKDSQIGIKQENSQTNILLSLNFESDSQVQKVSNLVKEKLKTANIIKSEDDIISLSLNGPSVSDYMKTSAIWAIIMGVLLMAGYMLISFRTIRKFVSPGTLAIVTVITMLFDVALPAGAYGLRMSINPSIQVDTIFIIASLTVMGYSINDTIIILDRIRENIGKQSEGVEKGTVLMGKIFDDSLRQTMRRSIGTSLSTFLAVLAMFIFGTDAMSRFAFTMGIGVLFGSYSSIFLSTPLVYILLGKFKKEQSKL